MIIDKQGKLFGKISIVDLLLVLILLAAALFVVFKFFGNDSVKQQPVECTYVVKVSNIKESSVQYFKAGDELYDDEGAFMGIIAKEPEVKPTNALNIDDDGNYVNAEVPGRVDILVTIKGEGIENDNGFYLDGKVSLLIGTNRFFKADDIDFTGVVTDVLN